MKTRFLLILLSLSFSGCSLIYSYSDDLPQKMNQWIAEKKYKLALNTISYIKPDHKHYSVLKRKKAIIRKKMAAYEETSIKQSNKYSEQGNWIAALNLLNEVEGNITNTKNIEAQRTKLLKKRSKVITAYENDVLNSQAEHLANKMPLYKKINNTVYKNEKNELDIAKFDRSRQETSLKLRKRSEKQYKKGQYDNALTTIDHALKLNPDEYIVSDLNKLKENIAKETKLRKTAYLIEIKTLINKLSQGYSHDILKETKEKIIWVNKIKDNETVYSGLILKLKKHLAAGIKQRSGAARNLYSKGKTQEALSIWIELKELEPDNAKLQSHIERAEKVLLKLEKLSNKPKK